MVVLVVVMLLLLSCSRSVNSVLRCRKQQAIVKILTSCCGCDGERKKVVDERS